MTQDFTAQTSDNLGADKIARSATAYALYNNGIWAGDKGLGTVDTTTTYNSGSGTWTKPAGYDDRDTVMIRIWGGGGSGAAINGINGCASGGGGGAFSEISYLYTECPATIDYVVGAGGAARGSTQNGANGGASYITVSGVEIIRASGGIGGTQNSSSVSGGAAGTATFLSGAVSPDHYNGAQGGDAGSGISTAGRRASHGGAGGGAVTLIGSVTKAGGSSFAGGAGGAGSFSTATAGTAPGGGGGGAANTVACTSGAGGAGRVEISILRGRHATYHSWFK